MYFRIALALGFPHPDYLLETLTWKQLLDWLIYYELEPFGEERADYRIGQLTAAVHNALRRSGGRTWKASDFLLGTPVKAERPTDIERMKSIVRTIVETHDGRVVEREKRPEE